jgi:hypothetical protein
LIRSWSQDRVKIRPLVLIVIPQAIIVAPWPVACHRGFT